MVLHFLLFPVRNSAMDMLGHVSLCTSTSVFEKEMLYLEWLAHSICVFLFYSVLPTALFIVAVSILYSHEKCVCIFYHILYFINEFNLYNGWKIISVFYPIFLIIDDIQLLFIHSLANFIYFSTINLSYDFFFPGSHWFIWVLHFCRNISWIWILIFPVLYVWQILSSNLSLVSELCLHTLDMLLKAYDAFCNRELIHAVQIYQSWCSKTYQLIPYIFCI